MKKLLPLIIFCATILLSVSLYVSYLRDKLEFQKNQLTKEATIRSACQEAADKSYFEALTKSGYKPGQWVPDYIVKSFEKNKELYYQDCLRRFGLKK